MSLQKKIKITLMVLVLALIIFALLPNESEKMSARMVADIKEKLKEKDSSVKVSDIYPADWALVCMQTSESTGAGINKAVLSKKFDVPEDQIKIKGTIKSASDNNWVLMFFFEPDTVEMFSIDNQSLPENGVMIVRGGKYIPFKDSLHAFCIHKSEAIFKMEPFSDSQKGLRLMNFNAEEALLTALPNHIQTALKEKSIDIYDEDCGSKGKVVDMGDTNDGVVYYAASPKNHQCMGTGGTALWIAQEKDGGVNVILSSSGWSMDTLPTKHAGLYDLRISGGNGSSPFVVYLEYNGNEYVETTRKRFDGATACVEFKNDPDNPFDCTN